MSRDLLPYIKDLFLCATDAYGTTTPDGKAIAVREPLTDEILLGHLRGEARVGAYSLDPENFASAICLDDDEGRPEVVRRIVQEFRRLGFFPLVEASKSKGYHVWVFTPRVLAGALRSIGLYVAHRAGVPELEVFPKQEVRPENGVGNYVWLPLFGADVAKGRTAFLNPENGLDVYPDQLDVLASARRASLETVASAQAEAEKVIGRPEQRRKEPVKDALTVGQRRPTLMRIAGANRRMGLGEAEIYPILAEVNRARCVPVLPDEEVRKIAKSITRYAPADPIVAIPQEAGQEEGTNPLEFPDVMTGLAGDFAELYSTYMESPKHMFYMSFLTCLGATVADRLTLNTGLKPQPRLFTLILGESGDDRKSWSVKTTVEFFREMVFGFPVCYGIGSAEGLQRRLEKDAKILLCFDEFKTFLSKCNIKESVLLEATCSLFELNHYESHTKTVGITLENVFVSMLTASTVGTYENSWSSRFTDIGFPNRLWIVPGGAERKHAFPAEIPEDARMALGKRLGGVLQHVTVHPVLSLSRAAHQLYDTWYMNRERGVHAKRMDTYALKLMALLAVNDLKPEVDEETVRKVIDLCDHQYRVRQLYDPIDADNAIAKMEESIRRLLKTRGLMTERDVKRHVHADRAGIFVYNKAKLNLTAANELYLDKTTKRLGIRKEEK